MADTFDNIADLFPGGSRQPSQPMASVERYERVQGGTRIVLFIPDPPA